MGNGPLIKSPTKSRPQLRKICNGTDHHGSIAARSNPSQIQRHRRNGLQHGLRQGELLRLTWADVDWQAGILTVSRTKGGKSRRVPMNSRVQDLLSQVKLEGGSAMGRRLFPFDARAMRRVFEKAVKKVGLQPFRFHDLRHTFASRRAMQRENYRTIMALGDGGLLPC